MTTHSDEGGRAPLGVLVVGGGPTGATLALVLARYGLRPRIIDNHEQMQKLSKSAALHARTLEIFDAIGVGEPMVEHGQPVEQLVLRTGYRDRVRVDFTTLTDTRYRTMIDIPQFRTEEIVQEELARYGIEVERGVTLTGFTDGGEAVRAQLTHADGTVEEVTTRWLVGCDGVHSTVRSRLGIAFEGQSYADDWVLCDATIDWPLPRNEMTFSGVSDGIYGVFPLPGPNRYRIAYTQNRTADGQLVQPSLEDVQASMRRTGFTGRIIETTDFSTFTLAHRCATAFRSGRVFLAGDAAHVHTPFGGQGLNLGVSDAFNVGWKLAYVEQGWAEAALLDSYEPERRGVARKVIALTHRGATAMLTRTGPRAVATDLAMGLLNSRQALRRKMARNLSQLAHNYRGTAAVSGSVRGLAAGERAPDVWFFDGHSDRHHRVSDIGDGLRHTLLLLDAGAPDPGRLAAVSAAVAQRYGQAVATHIVTTVAQRDFPGGGHERQWLDRAGDLRAYQREGTTTAVLIRPDGYLAHISRPAGAALLRFLDGSSLRGASGATGPSRATQAAGASPVRQLDLRTVNAYLLRGAKPILVDTGFPGMAERILRALRQAGITPEEISLIVLTHSHPDHAGSAKQLRELLRAPIALHADEASWAENGKGPIPPPVTPFGRVIKAITSPEFPAFTPDLLLRDGDSLAEFGVAATVHHTPGHTPGSLAILTDSGDAIVGDLAAGSMLRGNRPGRPLLADDPRQVGRDLQLLLTHRPRRIWFGHGRPAAGGPALDRLARHAQGLAHAR